MSNEEKHHQHGVMVRWQSQGILICGEPGVGKSSFALSLLNQGAQFIADDIVELHRQQDSVIASAPQNAYGFLHHRELGLLSIQALFGDERLISHSEIDCVVFLTHTPPESLQFAPQQTTTRLGVVLPQLTLCTQSTLSLHERLSIWLRQKSLADTEEKFVNALYRDSSENS